MSKRNIYNFPAVQIRVVRENRAFNHFKSIKGQDRCLKIMNNAKIY